MHAEKLYNFSKKYFLMFNNKTLQLIRSAVDTSAFVPQAKQKPMTKTKQNYF